MRTYLGLVKERQKHMKENEREYVVEGNKTKRAFLS